jgi:hypothetical protein
LCPATFEESESGLGRQVSGEGEAEAEAPGIVGPRWLIGVEELLEQLMALIGDPVDLA